MIKHSTDYLFDVNSPSFNWDLVLERLKHEGFVALRNMFPQSKIEDVHSRIKKVMERPSIGGSYGYYRKDYAKKLFDPCLLSGPVYDLLLNESVIALVERCVDGEVVLAECNVKHDDGVNHSYFPMHTDLMEGWTAENTDVVLTETDLQSPIAIGAMMYFHDTTDGAFCYAPDTANLRKNYGGDLKDYPKDIQDAVMSKMVRVEGKAGDLVLFDDRGFHGPEQPVSVSRTVLIFDYYKLEAFGNKTKAPIPVIVNDLGRLNAKQLRVLGLGIEAMTPYSNYHTRSYSKTPYYSRLSQVFERKFQRRRRIVSVKNKLRFLKKALPFRNN